MISTLAIKQEINKALLSKVAHKSLKTKYAHNPISFISSNCMGGVFSHDLGMQMCSPTVNLWMSADDYIRFIEHLDIYLSMPFIDGSTTENYPIANIGDITLHCIHYSSFDEAKNKWEERRRRINPPRMVFTFTDQNDCKPEHVKRFMALPFFQQ